MNTILVSGASGIVGYGTLRALKAYNQSLTLIGTTIHHDSVAQGFCDIFELAPATSDPGYISWLCEIIKKYNIDLIIPSIEADMYKWAEQSDEINKTGAIALLNKLSLIKLCKDKWVFYQALKEANMSCVIESSLIDDYDSLISQFGLPFLLKPRRGFASKGIVIVNDRAMFNAHKSGIGEILMVQPLVGDDNEEFTTSAFCDGKGGFFTAMTLRRKLSNEGFTDRAEVVDTDPFSATISQLCQLFQPLGPTNFQFRKCDDGIKLLEINPRISSATSIRTAFGYNESEMSVDYFLNNKKPSQPKIQRGKAVRYTDEFIFYEDSIHI